MLISDKGERVLVDVRDRIPHIAAPVMAKAALPLQMGGASSSKDGSTQGAAECPECKEPAATAGAGREPEPPAPPAPASPKKGDALDAGHFITHFSEALSVRDVLTVQDATYPASSKGQGRLCGC